MLRVLLLVLPALLLGAVEREPIPVPPRSASSATAVAAAVAQISARQLQLPPAPRLGELDAEGWCVAQVLNLADPVHRQGLIISKPHRIEAIDGAMILDIPGERSAAICLPWRASGDLRLTVDVTMLDHGGPTDFTLGIDANPELAGWRQFGWSGIEAKFGGPNLAEQRFKARGWEDDTLDPRPFRIEGDRRLRLSLERVGSRLRMLVDGRAIGAAEQGHTPKAQDAHAIQLWNFRGAIHSVSVSHPADVR